MNSTHKLLVVIILVVVVIYYVVPYLKKCYQTEKWGNTDKTEMIFDNNNDGILKLDELKCAPSCCKFNQWPLPLDLQTPKSEFIGSNFSCNNGQTSGGCVCIEPKDINTLDNHSGNLINNSCNK
jgi:hypothetical protein